ncbi:MAG: TIGR03087 family PEP-CTERM/XrtA system glycosyltransferase [Gemmatales bacterium]
MTESPKILYVTHRVPYPPDKGDRIRNYHILRYLSKQYRVHLACLADETVSETSLDTLHALCEQVAIIPVQSSLRSFRMGWSLLTGRSATLGAFQSANLNAVIHSWLLTSQFDLLLASSSSMAPYLQHAASRMPVIIDLVDVDSEKWLNYVSSSRIPQRWVYQREAIALRHYEQKISHWAKSMLLVSDAETALFRQIAPHASSVTVTNGVDLEYYHPSEQQARLENCVFIGALDYHPNIDAVCWFSKEVWPAVRQRFPHSTFQIVGRRPVAKVLKLAEIPGVEVIGQVPDVRPYVHSAQIVVAPLRIARGLQNKVLEAMAMAKPVVASPSALAGLRRDTTCPAISADSSEQWVNSLAQLFGCQDRCHSLGQQGRLYVETHYDWDNCLQPLQRTIERLVKKPELLLQSKAAATV